MPEFLGVLGFEIHHKAECNAALGNGLENKSSIPAMTAIIFAEASCPGDTRHSHAILSQKYPAST